MIGKNYLTDVLLPPETLIIIGKYNKKILKRNHGAE